MDHTRVAEVFSWNIPQPEKVNEAVTYFWSRPTESSMLTIIFKIHNPSKRRIRQFLEAHTFVTNLTSSLLEFWRESADAPRPDGAVAHMVRALTGNEKSPYRSKELATLLHHQTKLIEQATKGIFNSCLSDGVYRQCAEILIGWILRVSRLATSKRDPKEQALPGTAEAFYASWSEVERRYQRAMEVVASMNLPIYEQYQRNHHGLERRSKREARWIRSRLESMDSLKRMLTLLDALLDEDPSADQRQAFITDHLWKSGNKRLKRVREPWWWQRAFQNQDPEPVLGELSQRELEQFHDEISEMITYLEFIDEVIGDEGYIDSDKKPVEGPDNRLRYLLDIFISQKPSSYPQVSPVQLLPHPQDAQSYQVLGVDPDTNEDPMELYKRRMNWFQVDPQRRVPVDRILSEDRESEEVQGMFAALRMLKPPHLQPIRLGGTARPYHISLDGKVHGVQNRYFALLYERHTYELTLALFLHNRPGPSWSEEEQEDQSRRTKQHEEYNARRVEVPLYYVNAPETQFIPPKGSPVILCALECGQAYHMKRFVHQAIEQQRLAQQALQKEHQLRGREVAVAACLRAHTPFSSGKVVCELDNDGDPEFFAHVTAEFPKTERGKQPKHVIGISSYRGIYTYAVLDYAGTKRHIGDLPIPRHVDPLHGASRGSRNFIHEVANEIIATAWLWDAWIAIEDTSSKHQRAGVSRSGNRRSIGLPSQTIAATVEYKSRRAGMLLPRLISNISPRDCPWCHTRRPRQERVLQSKWFVRCPQCDQMTPTESKLRDALCSSCDHSWPVDPSTHHKEEYFTCPSCKVEPWISRWIVATVVAQRALGDLVLHQERSKALREKKKQ
jgi:hypothetical protein